MRSDTPRRRTYYMHTLNAQPSTYVPGGQIVFSMQYGPALRLCRSLREIRAQRKRSEQWRAKRGYKLTDVSWFGYRRVRLP